ncbi:MAG: phosphatase PAP2 family protein [Acidobacteriota bacterium]
MSETLITKENSSTLTPRQRKALYKRKSTWAFAVSLIIYAVLAGFAFIHPYFGWDLRIENFVQTISLPGFRELMLFLTLLGNGWTPYLTVIIASIFLRMLKRKPEAFICLVGVSAIATVNQLMKIVIGRPRPSGELVNVFSGVDHHSFPSGHTIFFTVFFGFLLFLTYVFRLRPVYRWILTLLFGGMIALIGLSRVYLGAHWPSDVIGGYIVGSLWLAVMIRVYAYMKLKEQKGTVETID